MWAVEELASIVREQAAGEFPDHARQMARWCLLDAIGAAAAGHRSASASALRSVALDHFASGQSRVWFTPNALRSAGAAMANSVAVSTLDIDDGHRASSGHPGAAIIPAVVAVGEEVDATGEEMVRAIILGYEVAVRVGAARDYSSPNWLATGRWGAYGVAAAVGLLKGLDAESLAHAITIAGVHTPVLYAAGPIPRASSVKEGIPWATLDGVMAVDLAERGFSGPLHFLDYSEDFDAERVLDGMRTDDCAVQSVYLKPYACCRWIHGAIDGMAEIIEEQQLAPADIQKIDVFSFQKSLRMNNRPDPGSIEDAQFSFPFSMALAILRGRDALIPMSADSLSDTEVVEYARRIEVHLDDSLDAMFPAKSPAKVSVVTDRGTFSKQVDHPLGDAANQMSYEQLVHKFRQATRHELGTAQQEEIISAAAELESTNARVLARLLQESKVSTA